MESFEKLGAFYLGRPYELENRKPKKDLLLYDSRDLLTHAVCLGMTGSGKTGLCIALLEEAAIDGIPAIVIDPKGDLADLLLTFPNLEPGDFLPWVNIEDAQKEGLTQEQYAAQQAEEWRQGLAGWGQDSKRIQRLRDSADFRIYTPGSNAGFPISILSALTTPPAAIRDDSELLHERVSITVTGLLALVGIEADPLKSREHILLSTIIRQVWLEGSDLNLETLIHQIQSPSFPRIGVMDTESFFPAKERFGLATLINNLLAAPGFSNWLEGEPLEMEKLLHTQNGKPRVAIFSIAHLNDAERMFFVSLLLNQTLLWVRAQSGTNSLRAILYMDEIFGYFPPVANPPSKLPLLTLLKQGRAFGLGVVLATQNPVDLDYKALSNTGTWFIGRLQTERDKARVIEGLEGVAASTGKGFDRQQMEQTLAGLSTRIFVLNNVHEDALEVFESRWAMSYLRGPLTRPQIKLLMDPVKAQVCEGARSMAAAATVGTPASSKTVAQPAITRADPVPSASRPVLPPDVTQYFVPVRSSRVGGTVYHPMVFATAQVRFVDKTLDTSKHLTLLAPLNEAPATIDWDQAIRADLPVTDLEDSPSANAQFDKLPTPAVKIKNYDSWKKELASWIYRTERLTLLRSSMQGLTSTAGEAERDFRIRLQQTARERRDESVEDLRKKYAPKIAALEERRRRAEQARDREAEQAKSQKVQTAISFGATLLSSFLGRKSLSFSTLGRATTAARGVSRSMKETEDVSRAEDNIETIERQLADLNAEFKAETDLLQQSTNPQTEVLETVTLKPTKTNITVKLLTLAWVPYWQEPNGSAIPAWQ